jgi:predicted nucleotidyltransferase
LRTGADPYLGGVKVRLANFSWPEAARVQRRSKFAGRNSSSLHPDDTPLARNRGVGTAAGPVRYTDAVMDAKPLLVEIGRRMLEVGLEAVLIGNAAAALQGAPVTTVDFDFFFRKTPRNMTKVKALAKALHATVLRPYYPVSDLYRVVRDDDGLQVDLMATAHGLRSFEGVRARATVLTIDGVPITVASLADIIKSKRAAGRPRDKAVIEILERAHAEATSAASRAQSPEDRE